MPLTSSNKIFQSPQNATENSHLSPLVKLKLRGLESQLTKALQNRSENEGEYNLQDHNPNLDASLLNSIRSIENLLHASIEKSISRTSSFEGKHRPSTLHKNPIKDYNQSSSRLESETNSYLLADATFQGEDKESLIRPNDHNSDLIAIAIQNVEQRFKNNLRDILDELDLNWLQHNVEGHVSEIGEKINRVVSNAEMISESFSRLELTIKNELITTLRDPNNNRNYYLLDKRIENLTGTLLEEIERNSQEIITLKKTGNQNLENLRNNILHSNNILAEVSSRISSQIPKGITDIKTLIESVDVKISKLAQELGLISEATSQDRYIQQRDFKNIYGFFEKVLSRLDELDSKYEKFTLPSSFDASNMIKQSITGEIDIKINSLESILKSMTGSHEMTSNLIQSEIKKIYDQISILYQNDSITIDHNSKYKLNEKSDDILSVLRNVSKLQNGIESVAENNNNILIKTSTIYNKIDHLEEKVDEVSKLINRNRLPKIDITDINNNIANISIELEKMIEPMKSNHENIWNSLKQIENISREITASNSEPLDTIRQIIKSIHTTPERLESMDDRLHGIDKNTGLLLALKNKIFKKEDAEKIVNAIKYVANKTVETNAIQERNYNKLLYSLAKLVEDEDSPEYDEL